MRLKFAITIAAVAMMTHFSATNILSSYQTVRIGNDMSWPNCRQLPNHSSWGIVGVTGGLDFKANKCLRTEATLFSTTSLYINSGWPGVSFYKQFINSPKHCYRSQADCLAYNYGFNAAEYAIGLANKQMVHSSMWWIDVETENSWTQDIYQNQATLEGMVSALDQRVFGAKVGFYSYPGQWQTIVGNWRPNLPSWVATGSDSIAQAKTACQQSFTGVKADLSQYTLTLDQDYVCNN